MEETERLKTSKSSDSSFSEAESSFKLELNSELRDKLKEIPEVFDYILKLEKIIKRYSKKIVKLRTKLKLKSKNEDVETQTDFKEEVLNKSSLSTSDSDLNIKQESKKSIVDDIKEAAEIAVQKTGFVYEETSGLYYDYNTGYYYNAEYGLYYDGTTGQYLQYNADTQSYEFHSQVSTSSGLQREDRNKRKKKPRRTTKESKRARTKKANKGKEQEDKRGDIEDGECSSSEGSSTEKEEDVDEEGEISDYGDISKSWPPCMRIIVESTDIPDLKYGSLHIITCSGGTIGREGSHSILLRDPNASKHHLKISFDENSSQYRAVDLGSRNGTLLNGKRMSPSKQESDAMDIAHGSKIQIGQTILLCHIHEGNQTCGHCEPGLIQAKEPEKEKIDKNTRSDRHKKELSNLKMLYGVAGHRDDDQKLASGYTDRAQKRRETVGSQNPHEKTQVASVDESINKENKGFKLLAKMGWKEGQSLGKVGDGLLEPIKPVSNEGTAGIGSTKNVIQAAVSSEKQIMWKKTKERFQKLPDSNNAFDVDFED